MINLDAIKSKVQITFSPEHLEVIDESHKHAGRSKDVTHVKIIIVSSSFLGKNLLNRHRAVYNCLVYEMSHGLHAVSVHAHTPEEWKNRDHAVAASPPCRGGDKTTH